MVACGILNESILCSGLRFAFVFVLYIIIVQLSCPGSSVGRALA